MHSTTKRRPCWVEISTRALEDNFQLLSRAVAGVELLAIVKADAYGHSLELCVPAAVRAGAKWLGVTSVEEGVAARQLADQVHPGVGLNVQILVIGGVFEGQAEAAVSNRLTPVVWEHWQLRLLEDAAKAARLDYGSFPVHLELDTGMSRQGASRDSIQSLTSWLVPRADCHLKLDGIMTHLYAADERDGDATRQQMERLQAVLLDRVLLPGVGLLPRWLHLGNSAATLGGDTKKGLLEIATRFGMAPMMRPGLALYGVVPEFEPDTPECVLEAQKKLRPVLEWKTQVVSLRSIQPGQVVGYNGTFVATEPMRLALLAVGYADGLKRALSNRGQVLVRGSRAPIVGRISMDQTVIDVTEIAHVAVADEVVLIGRQGAEAITAADHARWAGTIPWEIFTSIAARVERRAV